MSRTKRAPWRGVARTPTPGEQEAEGGQIPGQPPKKKLTTSAMIASLAAEGQRTSPAPFGRATSASNSPPNADTFLPSTVMRAFSLPAPCTNPFR